jgi:hypothetical protein
MQEVYATIAALPEAFREALVAVDVLGLSYREAARALRVREATITTRLFRARKQVAQHLAPEAAAPAQQRPTGPSPVERTSSSEMAAGGPERSPARPEPSIARPAIAPSRREELRASGVIPSRDTP